MKCLNFTCQNNAIAPWPCCDKICGWTYKSNLDQMRKYQEGIITWDYLKYGLISYFSIEECEYYNQKLMAKQNGEAKNYKYKVLE